MKMIIPKPNVQILENALEAFGVENQIEKYEEELLEVLYALHRYKKDKSHESKQELKDELCDNLITLLKVINVIFFNQRDLDNILARKEEKLNKLIEEHIIYKC